MEEYVNLMLISHSREVANGLKEMIEQVATNIKVVAIGGTANGEIGTDVATICKALEEIEEEGSTLIFYDIGSAKINASLALELKELPDVEIVEAPLVEGSYLAAVKASIGKSAQDIKQKLEQYFPNFFQDM